MTAAPEKWIAGSGAGLTWTDCFQAADLNSLANGSSVLSSTGDILNDTALDIFADVDFQLGSATSTAGAYLALYLYHKNYDSSYGDNVFVAGTQSSSTPSATLYRASFQTPVGTQAFKGCFERITLPPGRFRFLIQNKLGVAFASSANAIRYKTYNRAIG